MVALQKRQMVAELVGVHAVEPVAVDALTDGETKERNALLARRQLAVVIVGLPELADAKGIDVEIALVVQGRERVIGDVEAEAGFINNVLTESVDPLRREIAHVRRRVNR